MIVLTGSELFTSNIMVSQLPQKLGPHLTILQFMTVALCNRRITIVDLAKNWFISFFGNLAGMLFFMAIITGCKSLPRCLTSCYFCPPTKIALLMGFNITDGGVFHEEGYKEAVFTFAKKKCLEPQWHQIFLRAIGANWLVCMAVVSQNHPDVEAGRFVFPCLIHHQST